jgi:tetratricopeptide (TPR) repeat protein
VVVSDTDSDEWYLARVNVGEGLYQAGCHGEAVAVFRETLAQLGEEPAYNRCYTLDRLGRCYGAQGHSALAEETYFRALAEAEKLEPTPGARNLIGTIQQDLGDVLQVRGEFPGARRAYAASLAISRDQRNARSAAATVAQLGDLAIRQGDLDEARLNYHEALRIFLALNEPSSVATCWHMVGIVYAEQKRWDDAERAYREAARIRA